MIIDTHCHYNLEPLYSGESSHFSIDENSPLRTQSWQDHWQYAQKSGISHSLVIGTTLETSQKALEITRKEPNLFAAIGIHPTYAGELDKQEIEKILSRFETILHDKPQKVIAIGETGLDFFHLDKNTTKANLQKERQIHSFRKHLQIAQNNNLIPIVHVRDQDQSEEPNSSAYWTVINILKENWVINKGQSPFVLHCISGPLKYLEQALDLGAYIGVAANITYSNAHHLRNLIKNTPPDKLILETDAPYLPPSSHRGQVCEPWMIKNTATYLHSQLAISENDLRKNTLRLFARSQVLQ